LLVRLPGRVDIQPGLLYNRPLMKGGGAVVHGLLSTSTYGACRSVREILAGAGCWQLPEYRKPDGQVLPEERLTRLRNRAKA
jgi:hypothetical protein